MYLGAFGASRYSSTCNNYMWRLQYASCCLRCCHNDYHSTDGIKPTYGQICSQKNVFS